MEEILKEEYGHKDVLDNPQFNVHDFINKKFSNRTAGLSFPCVVESLDKLDEFVAEVETEQKEIDGQIAEEIRNQSKIEEEMRKAVKEQNKLVEELVGRITKIKSKGILVLHTLINS